jgi:hypothetical protein
MSVLKKFVRWFLKSIRKFENSTEPVDLLLPSTHPTDKLGRELRKTPKGKKSEIRIVGVTFHAAAVTLVSQSSMGRSFDIYLVPEPDNDSDDLAVAVYAGKFRIGYVARPANESWFEVVREAFDQGEMVWGCAKAIRKPGTPNTGIFGFVYFPRSDQKNRTPEAI